MKISMRVYRALAKLLLVLVALVFVGVLVFLGMQISGKNKLYGETKGLVPDMSRGADPGRSELLEAFNPSESDWQEGDVRYEGVHYRYNSDILTFLFLGIDKMSEVKATEEGDQGGQSDAIFLLVLDPHSKKATVIGIPRDTMAEIDVYSPGGNFLGTTTAQITLQHGYGDGAQTSCERSKKAVSKLLYDMPIHGYCAINMGAISLINDAVGGVEVTALEDVVNSNIKKGQTIRLQGQQAYQYVHNRDTNSAESAFRRLDRQKQYLSAYASTALSAMKKDITLPVTLYSTISKYMVTDITIDEVSYLATQVSDYSFDGDSICSLQGEVVKGEVYEEFYVDEDALYELILKVFYEPVSN
ncbi:MAG: LCP family protein [Clostridium sp.]|nr:LCP family protein [Acetatifactor muris]MCM1527326.1 LCP family protein [Bacteroides sp.]MCM1563605.1 LCP family protein [Clostridium sp.]